jgi:hypothetical protein
MRDGKWECVNGCKPPTSGTVIFEDDEPEQLWADGCCGGGCAIVQLNYCPVCGVKI